MGLQSSVQPGETKMKFLVAAFLAIALASSVQGVKHSNDNLKLHSEHCFESSGVAREVVANARKGEFVDDEKLMKYSHCVYKMLNFIDDEGHIHADEINDNLPKDIEKEEGSKIVKKCVDEVHDESDHIKKSFHFYKCFVKAVGKPVHAIRD